MRTDGAFGEHIRFALEVTLLIQNLQGTQQEITGIFPNGKAVAPTGKQTVLFRVLVIEGIELRLLFLNVLVGIPFRLVVNEPAHTIPEGNHSPDTVLCCNGDFHRIHAAVFPEVHLSVYNGVTEIPHIGVSGDGIIFLLQFLMLVLGDLGIECGNRFAKLFLQIPIGVRLAHAVHAEPCGLHDHLTQNHIRVLHKIAIHADTVGICVQMYPVRFNVRHAVPLLQEQNIAGDFRTGVALECGIG